MKEMNNPSATLPNRSLHDQAIYAKVLVLWGNEERDDQLIHNSLSKQYTGLG